MMPLLRGKSLAVVPRLIHSSVMYLLLTVEGTSATAADLAEVQPLDLLLSLTVKNGVLSSAIFFLTLTKIFLILWVKVCIFYS